MNLFKIFIISKSDRVWLISTFSLTILMLFFFEFWLHVAWIKLSSLRFCLRWEHTFNDNLFVMKSCWLCSVKFELLSSNLITVSFCDSSSCFCSDEFTKIIFVLQFIGDCFVNGLDLTISCILLGLVDGVVDDIVSLSSLLASLIIGENECISSFVRLESSDWFWFDSFRFFDECLSSLFCFKFLSSIWNSS